VELHFISIEESFGVKKKKKDSFRQDTFLTSNGLTTGARLVSKREGEGGIWKAYGHATCW